MATLYGTEITALDANPQDKVDPTRWNGRVHYYGFTWTGDAAQNDLVEVLRIPAYSRVIHGRVDFTDLGTSTTMDVGTSSDEDHWLAATDTGAAAAAVDMAHTIALYGLGSELLTSKTSVYLKHEAANPASGTVLGYMLISSV